MKKYLVFVCLVLFFLLGNSAYGQDAGLKQLVQILLDNKTITQTQYEQLMAAVTNIPSTEAKHEEPVETLVTTDGSFEATTYDGAFSFKINSTLMTDLAIYHQDKSDLGNGTKFRKAKLGIEGRIFSDWAYEFDVDFADEEADIDDAYVEYVGWWPFKLKVGQFKTPFGLEELTSSSNITFMERAVMNELAPGRKIGVCGVYHNDIWTASAGIFGEDFNNDVDEEGDEGWNVTGRFTFSPIHEDTTVAHFGMAISHEETDDENSLRFKTAPETDVAELLYLDTGKIKHVKYTNRYGLELAGIMGSFSLQGEYIHADVARSSGNENVDFAGWYTQASWFITGESRDYKFKTGDFGSVTPAMKCGAFELAMRYSSLDLTDGNIFGGKEENFTLGLNWYINAKLRMMLNYTLVDNDENADADDDVSGNDDPEIFQARVQLDL